MEKTIVTLKTILPFHDLDGNVKRFKGEEFECSMKRAKEIINHELKLVEIISIAHASK